MDRISLSAAEALCLGGRSYWLPGELRQLVQLEAEEPAPATTATARSGILSALAAGIRRTKSASPSQSKTGGSKP